MSESRASYRQIFKATSLFGGVQVFNIIISMIKSKFIAILLGPSGMGIAGLLTSTIGLIGSITNLGLSSSAVKNVSQANATNDIHKIAATVSLVRRLVWITGLVGMLITVGLSPWLSQLTFGNTDHTMSFVYISSSLLFAQITAGQLVVLQGMRKLKDLAIANLVSIVAGLLISIPLYYIWGVNGIVPALIVSALGTLLISWFFASKIEIIKVRIDKALFKTDGVDMVRMGIMLSLSALITLGTSYIIRIYINHTGGVEQVGLYNSGFAIINTYVGMVFTAMATDYYPRLAEASHDDVKSRDTINQQAEIAILIITPILAIFLTFIQWAVLLLYSEAFSAVNGMIQWAALGMLFKTASWAVGFLFLAKGSTKLYFWSEFSASIYILILNVLGYKFFGLDGLGISFLLGYVLYLAQVYVLAKTKFNFGFRRTFYKVFLVQLVLSVICFLAVKRLTSPWSYLVGCILILLVSAYSYSELEKRLGLKMVLKKALNKSEK